MTSGQGNQVNNVQNIQNRYIMFTLKTKLNITPSQLENRQHKKYVLKKSCFNFQVKYFRF